ncbi:MAG: fimbria/pilus periplasmic chaperone [Thermodesulfobacteriota bacterium]|nr:MAG: fimbria/pilus periplasmic chaperone [Thermodesulfobacteriota bacterium]
MKKLLSLFSVTALILLLASVSFSADFTVSPIKVYFKGTARTSAVTIKNNSSDPITLQVSVVSWNQDETGEDQYTPTDEIIAFPRIFKLKREEEQLIRIGSKVTPGPIEKTYRIYVSEIPQPQSKLEDGTVLRTLMRVGIPIFVEPVTRENSGKIEDLSLEKGRLLFSVANTGNRHFIMRTVKVEGKDASGKVVFTRELAGRYLHGKKRKKFVVEIPKKECLTISHLVIDVSADRLSMTERINVTPARCSP